MSYFTDLDQQEIFLFFDLFWSVLSRHSEFFQRDHLRSAVGIICGSGIICGPIWGSFAVGDQLRSRDHLRRCTGRHVRTFFFSLPNNVALLRFFLYMEDPLYGSKRKTRTSDSDNEAKSPEVLSRLLKKCLLYRFGGQLKYSALVIV